MNDPQTSRWQAIESLLDGALAQAPDARGRWLRAQAADAALIAEVEALLAADAAAGDFLIPGEASSEMPYLLPSGAVLGNWRVIEAVGRGGMGEVYRVERADGRYQQTAALKLLARLESAEDRQRFDAERRWLAQLEHPGIARLLDGGEWQGRPYAVMEFVAGLPITTALAGESPAVIVRRFLDVCTAVSHAHRHFIVHRDLKPGNVLMTAEGEVKLLDFGIAKSLMSMAGADRTQVLRLSPDYCAPEQLDGGVITAATDVYALGVLLYELLSGVRPFALSGLPVTRVLERLSARLPDPPSTHSAHARVVRGDLDAIVLKALRPEAGSRYPSVAALAEDLQAWQQARPVAARGGARGYVFRRFLLRQRRWVLLGTAVFLSLSAGLGATLWQARQVALERDYAQMETRRSEAVRDYLMLMFQSAGQEEGAGLTAREVLDRGAERVQQEFVSDPATQAAVLHALAELYTLLNQDRGAEPLLRALLETEGVDAEMRASASHDLALILARRNEIDAAAQALKDAQTFWLRAPALYQERLLESRLVEARILRGQGDLDGGIAVLEAAREDRLRRSGPRHRQVGILQTNLGAQYAYAGRYEEAVAAFEAAQAVLVANGLEASDDAVNLLNNWAAVETQRGETERAIPLFEQSIALRRSLYGSSGALAAALNNLGKTLLQVGRTDDARKLLEEGLPYADRYVGEHSLLAIALHCGLADAASQAGDPAGAQVWLERARLRVAGRYPDEHLVWPLIGVSEARALWSQQDAATALAKLDTVEAQLLQLGSAGAPLQAQVGRLRTQWSAESSR
jgi:eukaryotic-like serine/threonine-protein kinase